MLASKIGRNPINGQLTALKQNHPWKLSRPPTSRPTIQSVRVCSFHPVCDSRGVFLIACQFLTSTNSTNVYEKTNMEGVCLTFSTLDTTIEYFRPQIRILHWILATFSNGEDYRSASKSKYLEFVVFLCIFNQFMGLPSFVDLNYLYASNNCQLDAHHLLLCATITQQHEAVLRRPS